MRSSFLSSLQHGLNFILWNVRTAPHLIWPSILDGLSMIFFYVKLHLCVLLLEAHLNVWALNYHPVLSLQSSYLRLTYILNYRLGGRAVPTCSVALGQHPPQPAQPIIWHLVVLDGNLCSNSMFQQRLLICVMCVVVEGKTLISRWFHPALHMVEPAESLSGENLGRRWQLLEMFSYHIMSFFMWLQINCTWKKN